MEYMLTTLDNPYNPFTDYDAWYNYDESHGYCTCGYIARIAHTSDELSDEDNALAIDHAIDEIVSLNLLGNYIKITKEYKPRVVNVEE